MIHTYNTTAQIYSDLVPGTCTGHEAVSPLGGAESAHPGQHPGSQSWLLCLYVSIYYSIDSCNITDLLHGCGSPVSRPSCHWSNSAAVPTELPPPATAAPPLPDFSSIIGGILEEMHNILDTQKYIFNKHISKC